MACLFLWGISARADQVYMVGDLGPGNTNLYAVNSSNGASELIGSLGFTQVFTVAFDSQGHLYAIVNGGAGSTLGQLATVNLNTGAATLVGSPAGVPGLFGMAFAGDGTLYAASFATNDLYSINLTTGAASLIGSLGFSDVMDLAWDPFNNTMYAIASIGGKTTDSFIYSMNLMTGEGTLVTTITGNNCLMGLTVDSGGRFLATDFCDSNSPLFQIDLATGALTDLGDTGINHSMGGTNITPEPATLLLFGSGLLALSFLGRKRLVREPRV